MSKFKMFNKAERLGKEGNLPASKDIKSKKNNGNNNETELTFKKAEVKEKKDEIELEFEKLDDYKVLFKKKESQATVEATKNKVYDEQQIETNSDRNYDNITSHFNIEYKVLKEAISKPFYGIKKTFYNEAFGEILYRGYDEKYHNLSKQTILSHMLFKETLLNRIFPDPNDSAEINLDFKKNLDFRIFKYLDNYNDFYLSSSDIEIRQNVIEIYVFHILNHLFKKKELIEVNNKITEIICRDSERDSQKLKDELFKDKNKAYLDEYAESQTKIMSQLKKEYPFYDYQTLLSKFSLKNLSNINKEDQTNFDRVKDHGFTVPKVLILCPNRKHARIIIEEIVRQVHEGNKEVVEENEENEEENEEKTEKTEKKAKSKWKGIAKKKRFNEEFNETDSLDDCFRIGITYDYNAKKLKFYQSLDSSDIIISSPLGLKLTNLEEDNSNLGKNSYLDYLSSIEIVLIDFAEVYLYQNLEHLEEVLKNLNQTPRSNASFVDLYRIKDIYKETPNITEALRQNILISHFKSIELEYLVKKYFKNYKGVYYLNEKYESVINQIKEVKASKNDVVKFEFKLLKSASESDHYEFKFNYFTKNLWQGLYDTFERHTIIFVSSYLEYVRLKNFFEKNSVSVNYICEHTEKGEWQSNRHQFEIGKKKFLLYTERAQYYKKMNLRFARNIFFYSLPEDPAIFKEMIELIRTENYKKWLERNEIEDEFNLAANYGAVISLYSKFEKYNAEKILGTQVVSALLKNKTDSYIC